MKTPVRDYLFAPGLAGALVLPVAAPCSFSQHCGETAQDYQAQNCFASDDDGRDAPRISCR
jgi:hypothetical protein